MVTLNRVVIGLFLVACGGPSPVDEDTYWQQVAPEVCRVSVLCGDVPSEQEAACVLGMAESERDPDCFDGAAAASCIEELQAVTTCESSGPAFGRCEDVYAFENCPD